MAASRRNRAAWRCFDVVFRPWIQHHVRVCVAGAESVRVPEGPIMLVSNHVSWWDGFLLREVQRRIRPQSPLYTIALERELARHPVLRLIGGVGIAPSSPSSILSAIRALETRCSEEPHSVIGFFPQGRIAPSFRRPLGFSRGMELFARRLGTLSIVPVAIHFEPLNGMAPTAFVRVGEPELALNGMVNADAVQSRVEGLLDATLAIVAIHGEESVTVWNETAATSSADGQIGDDTQTIETTPPGGERR